MARCRRPRTHRWARHMGVGRCVDAEVQFDDAVHAPAGGQVRHALDQGSVLYITTSSAPAARASVAFSAC